MKIAEAYVDFIPNDGSLRSSMARINEDLSKMSKRFNDAFKFGTLAFAGQAIASLGKVALAFKQSMNDGANGAEKFLDAVQEVPFGIGELAKVGEAWAVELGAFDRETFKALLKMSNDAKAATRAINAELSLIGKTGLDKAIQDITNKFDDAARKIGEKMAAVMDLPDVPARKEILEDLRKEAEAVSKLRQMALDQAAAEDAAEKKKKKDEDDKKRRDALKPQISGVAESFRNIQTGVLTGFTGELESLVSKGLPLQEKTANAVSQMQQDTQAMIGLLRENLANAGKLAP